MDEVFVDVLEADGTRMVGLASEFGVDAVAPCPGWTVRELLVHTGSVHRWANKIVSQSISDWNEAALTELDTPEEIVEWFAESHSVLVDSLRRAPADLECITFLRSTSPRLHWRRRQAHETAIHRVDLEEALGVDSYVDPALADDGIDELLAAYGARSHRGPRMDTETRLLVETTDTGSSWLVTVGPDSSTGVRGSGDADVRLSGTAADLYTGLWNRGGRARLQEDGPPELMQHWRTEMKL